MIRADRRSMALIASNRTTGCSYIAAMLLLTFNSMQRPQQDQLSLDNQLVDRGLQVLDQIAEETQGEIVRVYNPSSGRSRHLTDFRTVVQARLVECSTTSN